MKGDEICIDKGKKIWANATGNPIQYAQKEENFMVRKVQPQALNFNAVERNHTGSDSQDQPVNSTPLSSK